MASFDKYLIFFALTAYAVTAENVNAREKKHVLIAGIPSPLLAYPYGYAAALPVSHAEDDGSYWPGKYENAVSPVAPKIVYSPSHAEDDGSYWPGKYDERELLRIAAAYPPIVYRHHY